ncbi:MAG: protease inhibitor I42 family protein [Syntrophomonadaceae bacterium]
MRKTMLVLLTLTMLMMPGTAVCQGTSSQFADGDRWAAADIQAISGLGLMNGTGTADDGQRLFSPQGNVSRAQLAAILTNTFGLDYGTIRFIKEPRASDYYQDVSDKDWYAPYVVMGAINQVFPTGGDFGPDQSATRVGIAQAVSHSFNAKGISVPMILMMPMFRDTGDLSQEEMNAVVFVNNTGIMKSYGDYFRPGDTLTRAEMAAVAMRCVELIAASEANQGQELRVPMGGIFYLSLASNPTTGYSWTVTGGADGVIQNTGSTYRPDDSGSLPVAGRGGRQLWRFQAVQEGTADLQLVYARPWESVQPDRYNLKVIVTPTIPSTLSLSTAAVLNKDPYMTVDAYLPVLHGLADQELQSRINAGWQQDLQKIKAGLTADLDEYVRYNLANGFPVRTYQLFSRYQAGTLNQNLLSLYVDYYTFTGGAHGNTDRRPYNLDLHSGQPLGLADIFQNGYDYRGIINREISARIAAEPENYFTGSMGFTGINDEQSFYIKDGQLVIYFAQYEIAPYATGIPEFAIPLSQFGDGLQTRVFAG